MKKQRFPKQSSAGFTLLEMLVIMIIIGVLAAIAAPGWLAFLNRQRLGRSGEQIVQALRAAQAEAKRTSTYREVRFDNNADQPRYAVLPVTSDYNTTDFTLTLTPLTTVPKWENFAQGEVRQGTLTLAENNPNGDSIIFGPRGEVVRNNIAPKNPKMSELPFVVTMSLKNAPTVKRCVRVETLLGAISQGEGNACP